MKEKIKVAFQGEKGAYSHLVCLEVFPNVEAVARSTFEESLRNTDGISSNPAAFTFLGRLKMI